MRYNDKRRFHVVPQQGSAAPVELPGQLLSNQTPLSPPSPDQVAQCQDALQRTSEFVQRYVSLTNAQADVIALWVAHTHIIYLFNCTPYLAVTSVTKRCGKTRLLETCELLVHEPLRTANITEAALFRVMAASTRTLLMDEFDTIFGEGKSKEQLRAILNAGYRRGSPTIRTKGRGTEELDAFGPKMLAGIGDLPDTVADRSIPIRLERKTPNTRFRLSEVEPIAASVKGRVMDAFHQEEVLYAVYTSKPQLPAHLHDRQQDSWEALIQVAGVASWLDRAYAAAADIHGDKRMPWERNEDGSET